MFARDIIHVLTNCYKHNMIIWNTENTDNEQLGYF